MRNTNKMTKLTEKAFIRKLKTQIETKIYLKHWSRLRKLSTFWMGSRHLLLLLLEMSSKSKTKCSDANHIFTLIHWINHNGFRFSSSFVCRNWSKNGPFQINRTGHAIELFKSLNRQLITLKVFTVHFLFGRKESWFWCDGLPFVMCDNN